MARWNLNLTQQRLSDDDFVQFDSIRFVNQLLDPIVKTQSSEAFKPRALEKRLSDALEEVQRLSADTDNRIGHAIGLCAMTERAHKQKLAEQQSLLDDMIQACFKQLDSRINSIGSTAVRVGDHLASVDVQRQRATDAKQLIETFLVFNTGTEMEKRKSLPTELDAKVRLLKQLSDFVRDHMHNVPGTQQAQKEIDRFTEEVQNQLLDRFTLASQEDNYDRMRECASVLIAFANGDQCNRRYVATRSLFQSFAEVTQAPRLDEDDDPLSRQVDYVDPVLTDLFARIMSVLNTEHDAMRRIFPNPGAPMSLLISRIYEQTIQDVVGSLLERDLRISKLRYVQTLSTAYRKSVELIDDLSVFGVANVGPPLSPTSVAATGFTPSASSSSLAVIGKTLRQSSVSTLHRSGSRVLESPSSSSVFKLQRSRSRSSGGTSAGIAAGRTGRDGYAAMHEIDVNLSSLVDGVFVQWRESYPDMEVDSLDQVMAHKLGVFLDAKRDANASGTAADGQRLRFGRHKQIGRGSLDVPRDGVSELVSLNLIGELMQDMQDAVQRALQLCNEANVASTVHRIGLTGLKWLLHQYASTVLDAASNRLPDPEKEIKTEPALTVFAAVMLSNQCVHHLNQHFKTWIAPILSEIDKESLTALMLEKQALFSLLTCKINDALRRVVDSAIRYVARVLSTEQKKNDFRPKEDVLVVESDPTLACRTVVAFLIKVRKAAESGLDGRNRTAFATELLRRLHQTLFGHMKRFNVNSIGALKWLRDLKEYQEVARSFDAVADDFDFDFLREVANLWLVSPGNLRDLIEDTRLAHLDRADVMKLLQLRYDWKVEKLGKLFKQDEM